MWWQDAVVYQIYPRSFQDSDGDGVGDLRGIAQRLDHLVDLGVDALWLSPIYPSPLADFGYDVSDYTAIDPQFGTLADFDALVAAAHERGLRVLLDLVACHTSIEHPWFREHPDRYIWSPVDGPPNNWVTAFGGPAWSRDDESGRWYLHSFYPEQPDLNWRNPEVVAAMQDVVRFWLDRGVDGFRLDAIDRLVKDEQLRDDPPASEAVPAAAASGRRARSRCATRATGPRRSSSSAPCARPPATRCSWASSSGRWASTRHGSRCSTWSSPSSSSSRPGTRSGCAPRSSRPPSSAASPG